MTSRGPRSITLRRCCLVLVVAGLVWNCLYQHDVGSVIVWWLALLIYGTIIAAAVQHVYRDVRVGWAETYAMALSTVLFVFATLIAPRQVGVHHHVVKQMVTHPGDILPSPDYHSFDTALNNAPLLKLFGHHDSVATSPWLAIAYVLAIATMVGVCAQWWLVWRLGRDTPGVFDPAVTAGGATDAATLDAPLGTSVTRPATGRRAPRQR